MSVLAAHDCTFSDITIHGSDVGSGTVKGIDIQEYACGGNTNNQFEDITIYDIETTGTGSSIGIYFEGDNPGTHPTTGNTFTNIDIYDLASEDFNCGVYILDTGYYTGTGHMNPYAIEDTTFSGGNIYGFTESDDDVDSIGFYVKGGNENLDITCFDITGCNDGFYFKGYDWVQPPTFPPTGWVNDDAWAASTGNWMVSPRTGSYAAGIEICTSTPDDYLIMPQQSISSGDSVSFYAHGTHFSGPVHFQLKVSTTGTNPTDFTDTIGTFTVPTATGSWLHVSENLDAYDGNNIYIAIYAYESTPGPSSELLIDDVTLPDSTTEGFEGTTTTIGAVDVTVNSNNIHGNTNYGVDNSNGVGTIDAENNWWGDASGPSVQGPGTGDAVSTNVDYDPWSFTPDPCEPRKTMGFWKNHEDSVDAVLYEYGPISLGAYELGSDPELTDVEEAQAVFNNATNKNANTMLAAQLLAAKLNVAHLAHLGIAYLDDCDCIDVVIDYADEILIANGYNGPDDPGDAPQKQDKKEPNDYKGYLDDFNQGGCTCPTP